MNSDDKLEGLLDRALSEYAQVGPRTGFEQRILANLQSQSKSQTMRWWWLAVPTVAVIAIITVLLGLPSSQSKPQVAKVQNPDQSFQSTAPAKHPIGSTEAPIGRHRKQPRRAPSGTQQQSPEPRLSTFPSRSDDDELIRVAQKFAHDHAAVAVQITQEQQDFRQVAETFTAPLTNEH